MAVVVGLALAVWVRASGLEAPRTTARKAGPAIFGPVRAAQLVTGTRGWALTTKRLAWTDDGGATWRDITPPQAPALGARGVFFLDRTHGWAVASIGGAAGGGVALGALRTADGGRTWASTRLSGPSGANAAAYSGPAWLQFVDALHGWILVKDVSSSNFSFGRLYRTSNGGRTWSALQAPLGDPVTFVDQHTGWTAGGPAGDRLFVTRDAGRTWKAQSVRPPAGARGRVAYALPVQAGGSVLLPVTVATGDQATVAWYSSRDQGRSWRLASRVATADRMGPGARVPVAAAGADSWVSVLPSSRRIVRLADSGDTVAVQGTPTAPAGVQDLRFTTATVGWALTASGDCAPGAPCAPGRVLFSTRDGGSTWQEVAVQ